MEICEQAPIQERGIFGNIYFRKLTFEGGQILPAHRHNFDHATFVWEGSVRVRFAHPDGSRTEESYTAPDVFNVPAMVGHEIGALTPQATVFCVFAVRDKDGQVTEQVTDEHRKDRFYHYREGQGEWGSNAPSVPSCPICPDPTLGCGGHLTIDYREGEGE